MTELGARHAVRRGRYAGGDRVLVFGGLGEGHKLTVNGVDAREVLVIIVEGVVMSMIENAVDTCQSACWGRRP